MFGGLDYFSYGLVFSVSNRMNAHANTTIILIHKTFTRLFLFIVSINYTYVCRMKNKQHNQIKTQFILIIDKGLFYPHNKDGGKIYPLC